MDVSSASPCAEAAGYTCQCTRRCGLAAIVQSLVEQAVAADRARRDAEEAAIWAKAFGPNSPTDPALRDRRIITIASARALFSQLNAEGAR